MGNTLILSLPPSPVTHGRSQVGLAVVMPAYHRCAIGKKSIDLSRSLVRLVLYPFSKQRADSWWSHRAVRDIRVL